jgi:uncharacterized repeat protein (TIGR03803 family)
VKHLRPQWMIQTCGFIVLNVLLLRATVMGQVVALSWNASTSSVAGYNVYRSGTSGGPYTRINLVLETSTAYADSSVQAGHTYYYVTTALSHNGRESSYSNQTTAVIPKAGSETMLYAFAGGTTPKLPYAGLVEDKAGNLYATTELGGAHNQGTVFELSRNSQGTWTERVLYSFVGGTDGAYPHAALVFDSSGNLYGTTSFGGDISCAQGCGTVFQLTHSSDGWSENILYAFTGGSDGREPYARLVFDAHGNLYGTTLLGGYFGTGCASGCGTAFRLSRRSNSWAESVLYDFKGGKDGASPYAGVTFDAVGKLYGVTYAGGVYGNGTVFRLSPQSSGSSTKSVLYSFTGGSDGKNPLGDLVLDAAGHLYGTTFQGGHEGLYGVVFELLSSPSGAWQHKILHTFYDAPAANPMAGLVFDRAGNLYGTTTLGANLSACAGGCGTLFKLAPGLNGSWIFSVLHLFGRGTDGYHPSGQLILGQDGYLWGTTQEGGSHGAGAVFRITP